MITLDDRQIANFEAMVCPEPNTGCWLWTGHVNRWGYGHFNVRGKIERSHRVAFEHYRSVAIPDGHCVLHNCDQPSCVNPDHLRLGTDVENAADKAKRGRVPRKLTADQVNAVRKADGTYREIGQQYGISPAWVCRIKNNEVRLDARRSA